MTEAPLCLAPRVPRNPLGLTLPQGTVDCHFHVFDKLAALASPRSYTPNLSRSKAGYVCRTCSGSAAASWFNQVSTAWTIPSCLRRWPGSGRFFAASWSFPLIPPAELQRLHELGVRGVRINLRNKAGIGLDAVETLAPRVRGLGWHLQFQVGPDQIATVADLCDLASD